MKRLLLLLFVVGVALTTTSCKTSFEKSVDIVIDDGIIDEEEAKTIMSEKPTEMTSEELVNFVMERCKKAGVDMKREDVEKALKQKDPDSKREITVSIYLDNTSSMEGYYKSRDISRFTSIISAINDYYASQSSTKISAYYTQSDAKTKKTAITQVAFDELQNKLTHNNMTFGDSYQLDEFFNHLVNRLQNSGETADGIAFFITDGIPSGTNDEIKNSIGRRYSISNKGVLESRIADRIRPLANNGYSAAIYQFESNFTGDYYKYDNSKVRLNEKSRPFYVIAIGKNNLMDLFTSSVENGLQYFKPINSLVFDMPKESFTLCSDLQVLDNQASDEIKLQLPSEHSGQVEFQIKRKALPHYLRDEETIKGNLLTIEMRGRPCPYRVTNNVITFNAPIDDNVEYQRLHIKVRDIVPAWVELSNSDDDASMSATQGAQDYLTFNFKCLVQGIKKGIYNSKGAEYWIDTTFKINTKVD